MDCRNQDRTDVEVKIFKINTQQQPLQCETINVAECVVERFTCEQIQVIYLNWKRDKQLC